MLDLMSELAAGAPHAKTHEATVTGYYPGVALRGNSFRTTSRDPVLKEMISVLGEIYYDLKITFDDFVQLIVTFEPASEEFSIVDLGLYRGDIIDVLGIENVVGRLAEFLVDVGGTEGIRTGIVNADTWGADKYYFATQARWVGSAPDMTRHVPGYQWCVLLGAGQIDALGGIDKVRNEAPVHYVRQVHGERSPAVVAQLTEKFEDRTIEQVKAWRAYLEPVLRPALPVGDFDEPQLIFEGDAISEDVADAMIHLPRPQPSSLQVTTVGRHLPGAIATCRLHTTPLDDHELGQLITIVNGWRVAGQNGAFRCDPDENGQNWKEVGRIGAVSDVDVTDTAEHHCAYSWTADLANGPGALDNLASGFHGRVHELDSLGMPSPYLRLEIIV
jgi:hypothetical protein